MYRILAFISTILILGSCSCFKHIPREEVHVVIKDSTVVNIKDSTVFHYKTVNRDYAGLLDTLRIQGEHSSMKAFADTANFTIKGELTEEPAKEVFKEKIVYREHRDTLWREKEVPVEVVKEKKVVPKWCWRLLVFDVVLLLVFAVWIYLKFSKVDIRSLLKKI